MYHNFAKNICCLKCQLPKPAMLNNHHLQHQHLQQHPQHPHLQQHHPQQVHQHMPLVNLTAAAIAAATALGQPLNLANGFLGLAAAAAAALQQHSPQTPLYQLAQLTPQRSSRNNSLTYAKPGQPQHTGGLLGLMGSGLGGGTHLGGLNLMGSMTGSMLGSVTGLLTNSITNLMTALTGGGLVGGLLNSVLSKFYMQSQQPQGTPSGQPVNLAAAAAAAALGGRSLQTLQSQQGYPQFLPSQGQGQQQQDPLFNLSGTMNSLNLE